MNAKQYIFDTFIMQKCARRRNEIILPIDHSRLRLYLLAGFHENRSQKLVPFVKF